VVLVSILYSREYLFFGGLTHDWQGRHKMGVWCCSFSGARLNRPHIRADRSRKYMVLKVHALGVRPRTFLRLVAVSYDEIGRAGLYRSIRRKPNYTTLGLLGMRERSKKLARKLRIWSRHTGRYGGRTIRPRPWCVWRREIICGLDPKLSQRRRNAFSRRFGCILLNTTVDIPTAP